MTILGSPVNVGQYQIRKASLPTFPIRKVVSVHCRHHWQGAAVNDECSFDQPDLDTAECSFDQPDLDTAGPSPNEASIHQCS